MVDHPNKFMLVINWTSNNDDLIPFDTDLLLTYRVMQGDKITPVTFEDTEDTLIPVNFIQWDYNTFGWITSDWFDTEIFSLNPTTENSSLFTPVAQGQTITVVNLDRGCEY